MNEFDMEIWKAVSLDICHNCRFWIPDLEMCLAPSAADCYAEFVDPAELPGGAV